VVTSTTVPRTLDEVRADINRYQLLANDVKDEHEDEDDDKDEDEDEDGMDIDGDGDGSVGIRRLPKPNKITAGLVNTASFFSKHQKKREKRKKAGEEDEKKRAKERREREIRTKRAYGKIAGQERRYLRSHAQSSSPDTAAVVHCIGHWQGVNCGLKGHARRGMKKIRQQHSIHGHVGTTDEFNTSKTCPFCFSRVVLHRARRTVDGVEKKVVRLNGAVECVHPTCPARKLHYTTRGRDTNAAANIALSGASVVLAADNLPLPCYRRSTKHSRYNLDKNFFSGRDTQGVHLDPIRKDDLCKNRILLSEINVCDC
jgi:hypothetical protein